MGWQRRRSGRQRPNVTYIYTSGGVYTVTLWVRDDDYPYSADEGSEMGEIIMTIQVIVNDAPVENIDPLLPSPLAQTRI